MSTQAAWTLADARRERKRAETRFAFGHRWIAPVAKPIVRAGLACRRLFGAGEDQRRLCSVSRMMNRNMQTAFAGYQPGAGDIVTSAYFKAGTNWVMQICHQIAHLGQGEFEHIQDVMPWPDAAEPRYWLNLHDRSPFGSPTGWRVIKSHLPSSDVPLNPTAKYVAVMRDPKDCAASAYHYFRTILLGPTMPPPDTWVEHFLSDEAIFGRWDEFAASWWALRDEPNVLLLKFEDIKADPEAVIDQIVGFLSLSLTDDIRQQVLKASSFQTMRKINHRFYPVRQSIWTEPDGKIIRKGRVGDSKSVFSSDALSRIDEGIMRGLAERNSNFPYRENYVRPDTQ